MSSQFIEINGVQVLKGSGTSVPGPRGEAGKSAYQTAVENGFVGNETQWIASLKGERGNDSVVPGPAGAPGSPGPAGAPGVSASIAIGTVSASAPGSAPQVTNTGTAQNAVLSFVLPRGETGPAGSGSGGGETPTLSIGTVTDVGTGTPTASITGTAPNYLVNFGLKQGAQGAASTVPGPTGATGPAGSAATISVAGTNTVAAGGSASVVNEGSSSAASLRFNIPRGDTGATGASGSPGTAATVAVGTTTTGAAGTNASVTNSGTSSAATLNFTIPRGDTGATGSAGATGEPGPANTLSIGTVTTLAAGASVTASITGTAPSQTLSLGIPQGAAGSGGAGVPQNSNRSGRYYSFNTTSAAVSPISMTQDQIYYIPVRFTESIVIDSIGIYVTTSNTATIRIGLYSESNGVPLTQLRDFGSAVPSSNAALLLSGTHTLSTGLYFLGIVSANNTTTANFFAAGAFQVHTGTGTSITANSAVSFFRTTGNVLPTTVSGAIATYNSSVPAIWWRVA